MIAAVVSDETFSYDIHSLTKAFYPSEDVKVFLKDTGLPVDVSVLDLTGLPDTRDECKRALYRRLFNETGKRLPWGTLTGIRPTRIALNLLYNGADEDAVRTHFQNTYFTSEDKINLALTIARREKEILDGIDLQNGYCLYIGIPFCPTTCAYCSFPSYPMASYASLRDDYVTALVKEIEASSRMMADRKLLAIYIGGGTPTTLTTKQMERLMRSISDTLDLTHLKEYTVESGRPDAMEADILHVLKNMGADRICVNPQTMKQKTLDAIGRHHTTDDTVRAFHAARKAGFTNINMDLILGLPGENAEDVAQTMDEVCTLSPDDLTLHSLAVKRGSFFHRKLTEGETMEAAADPDEMMRIATKKAAQIGCTPYYLYRQKNMTGNLENTGFAKPGKEGLYNILINEEVTSIVALGAGAISKRVYNIEETPEHGRDFAHVRIERSENVRELALYLTRTDEMIARKRMLFS